MRVSKASSSVVLKDSIDSSKNFNSKHSDAQQPFKPEPSLALISVISYRSEANVTANKSGFATIK